jgi:hypothetical protein
MRLFKTVLKAVLDGELCELVFFGRDVDGTMAETAINDVYNDNVMFPLAFMQSNEVTWVAIETQLIYPSLGDPITRALSFPGQDGDPAAPSVVAMVCSLKTGLGGRSNRGRKYLFGMPANTIDGSFFTQAAVDNAVAKWGQIHTALKFGNAVSDYSYGILHRIKNGVKLPPHPDNYTPISSVVPKNYVATMRSRRP